MFGVFLRRLKTLRSKIFFSFLSFIALSVIWIAVYFTINTKRNQYAAFADELSAVHNRLLQSNVLLQNFITAGYHNPTFYSTKREQNIDAFIDRQQEVIDQLSSIEQKASALDATYVEEVAKLEVEQRELADSVKLLKTLYLERGFKDHGAEGRMREAAHKIEEEGLLPEINILRLRRLEKDFLLRGESQYVERFNTTSNKLLEAASGNSLVLLKSYQNEFNRLVSAVGKIGVSGESGVLLSISNQIKKSDEHFNLINELHAIEFGEIQRKYNVLLLSITVAFALFIIGLSVFLSRKLTNELKELNLRMFNFIRARFRETTEDSVTNSFKPGTVEIDQLNKLFVLMKRNLKSTLHDLEKSSADAKRISEYKSQFLANMSHEMRTPLNGVIGMVAAIEKTKLDEEQTECVSIIKYSSNHLLELINSILDYSKIESGKFSLNYTSFDLKSELELLAKTFKYKVAEKNLKFDVSVNIKSNRLFFGDLLRLQQVLINLINNAIKFSESGVISLNVLEVGATNERVKIFFEIKDQGIGMDPWQLNGLFEAFSQGDSGSKKRYEGTGLGLAISQKLVNLMGGKILVKSEPGKGSQFYFEVDFDLGKEANPSEEIIVDETIPIRVLVAEDNEMNQVVVKYLFKNRNIQADYAINGKEAVAMFEANEYDLILMDLHMPEMDGWEAGKIILASQKYASNEIPVVALTANAFDDDRRRVYDMGMTGFVSKPIVINQLEGYIALSRHQKARVY